MLKLMLKLMMKVQTNSNVEGHVNIFKGFNGEMECY